MNYNNKLFEHKKWNSTIKIQYGFIFLLNRFVKKTHSGRMLVLTFVFWLRVQKHVSIFFWIYITKYTLCCIFIYKYICILFILKTEKSHRDGFVMIQFLNVLLLVIYFVWWVIFLWVFLNAKKYLFFHMTTRKPNRHN